jgi:anti-sigma factor RsiW
MNCTDIQKLLSAYIDRQLAAWENAPVAEHLETCATCQSDLQALIEVKRTLRGVVQPRLPGELRSAILEETVVRSDRRNRFAVRWWVPTFALAAAFGGWFAMRAAEQMITQRSPQIVVTEYKPPHRAVSRKHDLALHHPRVETPQTQ